MLPSKPKIFHGCEVELEEIMRIVDQEYRFWEQVEWGRQALREQSSTIQIRGKFEQRFFVSAESATTSVELP
jgi:hypothetical protein